MFEALLALAFYFLTTFYIREAWLVFVSLGFLILLILPGLWAMLTGAPFVFSEKKKIETAVALAKIGSRDVVYDLGCGDGRVIRALASVGARRAVGYEFSVPTYLVAKLLSLRIFGGKGEEIIYGNFWKADLSDADVVFCFLLPKTMIEFERVVWPKLKKGARVVSHAFRIKGVEASDYDEGIYLYVK